MDIPRVRGRPVVRHSRPRGEGHVRTDRPRVRAGWWFGTVDRVAKDLSARTYPSCGVAKDMSARTYRVCRAGAGPAFGFADRIAS
jgi:hypothetical protein